MGRFTKIKTSSMANNPPNNFGENEKLHETIQFETQILATKKREYFATVTIAAPLPVTIPFNRIHPIKNKNRI